MSRYELLNKLNFVILSLTFFNPQAISKAEKVNSKSIFLRTFYSVYETALCAVSILIFIDLFLHLLDRFQATLEVGLLQAHLRSHHKMLLLVHK